jgi:hypothetical protein
MAIKKQVKKKDTMYDYSTFKMDIIRMSPEKFMKLPAYFRNRDVDGRVSKMVKRLSNGALPTHLIVAVGKCTQDIKDANGKVRVKKGQYIRLDGHTRTDAWKVNPDLVPNVDLFAIVYDLDTYDYTLSIYNDIDSPESVEKVNEKISGLLRERNYVAKSDRIKKCTFKTAVINSCRYAHNSEGVYINGKEFNNKFEVKLDYMWEELTTIDSIGIDSIERYSGNVLTTFLLLTKKYGTSSRRLRTLIDNYKEGITTVNTSTMVDGVHYVYNNLYPDYQTVWTQTGFSNSFDLVSKILYSFDMFMRNENISKKTKFPTNKKLREFYQEYIK